MPVFLPGQSREQRSLVGYSLLGCRVRHDLATEHSTAAQVDFKIAHYSNPWKYIMKTPL